MNASESLLDLESPAPSADGTGGFSFARTLRRRPRSAEPRPADDHGFVVRADEHGLSLSADGESRTMAWAEMQSIRIEVNDRQPFGVNLWWAVEGPTKRMFFPGEARGGSEVKQAFRAFITGFDAEAVARAEQAQAEARIICWERRTALASSDQA